MLAARLDGAALFPHEFRLRQPGVAAMGEQFELVRAWIAALKAGSWLERLAAATLAAFPSLRAWVGANPLRLIEHGDGWERVLAVLRWFAAHPRPGICGNSIRQGSIPSSLKRAEAVRGVARSGASSEEIDKRFLSELSRLTESEQALFSQLRDDVYGGGIRLEQERIGYEWVVGAIRHIASDGSCGSAEALL